MTTLDVDKSELLSKATDLAVAGKGTGGPPHETVGALLNAYYRHVAPEDVVDRTEVDVYGALASHFKLAGNRPQGTARVHAFTPSLSEHGWSAGGHSVVEVVTDDMPFLVDSLTMELSRQLRTSRSTGCVTATTTPRRSRRPCSGCCATSGSRSRTGRR